MHSVGFSASPHYCCNYEDSTNSSIGETTGGVDVASPVCWHVLFGLVHKLLSRVLRWSASAVVVVGAVGAGVVVVGAGVGAVGVVAVGAGVVVVGAGVGAVGVVAVGAGVVAVGIAGVVGYVAHMLHFEYYNVLAKTLALSSSGGVVRILLRVVCDDHYSKYEHLRHKVQYKRTVKTTRVRQTSFIVIV